MNEAESTREELGHEEQRGDPRDEPLAREGKIYLVRDHMAALINLGLLLAGARTLLWFNAWVVGALMLVIKLSAALTLLRLNPAVLNARGTKRDMSPREKRFFALFVPLSLALPLVAGLDAGAAGWTHASLVQLGVGVGLSLIGGAITIWALAVNAFFEPTVRLQADRAHQVCTAGPYRLVRHPGYLGTLLVVAAMPLITGSRWMWIIVALEVLLFVVRTRYEDRMLHEELEGYAAYAERTRKRLVPGIW